MSGEAQFALSLDGLRVVWDADALAAAAAAPADASPDGLWAVEGELDAGRAELVRIVGAGFEDGRAIGAAALRPVGAAGHGDEHLRALLRRDDGELVEVSRALLSTEYDASGLIRRAGLELLVAEGGFPLRVAADAGVMETRGTDARPRELVAMRFRLEGVAGAGAYELVRAG